MNTVPEQCSTCHVFAGCPHIENIGKHCRKYVGIHHTKDKTMAKAKRLKAHFIPVQVEITNREPIMNWKSENERVQTGEMVTATIEFHSSGYTKKISNTRILKKLMKTIIKAKK